MMMAPMLRVIRSANVIPFACYPVASLHGSAWLCAEPLKKKKRIDPAIVRARLERKKRKLEKTIRQLLRQGKKLKPIEELTVDLDLIYNFQALQRKCEVTEQEAERRIVFLKEWAKYNAQKRKESLVKVQSMIECQERAMRELKLESEELYDAAMQVNTALLPFRHQGPPITAPIAQYDGPSGEYKETTRKWE